VNGSIQGVEDNVAIRTERARAVGFGSLAQLELRRWFEPARLQPRRRQQQLAFELRQQQKRSRVELGRRLEQQPRWPLRPLSLSFHVRTKVGVRPREPDADFVFTG
jgi:hypothetical protein